MTWMAAKRIRRCGSPMTVSSMRLTFPGKTPRIDAGPETLRRRARKVRGTRSRAKARRSVNRPELSEIRAWASRMAIRSQPGRSPKRHGGIQLEVARCQEPLPFKSGRWRRVAACDGRGSLERLDSLRHLAGDQRWPEATRKVTVDARICGERTLVAADTSRRDQTAILRSPARSPPLVAGQGSPIANSSSPGLAHTAYCRAPAR